jgi:catalase
MTPPEQGHIVSAFTFELSKVVTKAVRTRMLGHLDLIEPELGERVAAAMGMEGQADDITPAVEPRDNLPPSPPLSLVTKAPATIKGRTVVAMITNGFDGKLLASLAATLKREGAALKLVAPKIGPVKDASGARHEPASTIDGGPSVLFDACVILPSEDGAQELLGMAAAINWIRDAFGHLKAIAYIEEAAPLLDKASVEPDVDLGVIELDGEKGIDGFIAAAKQHRIWEREKLVKPPV